VEHGGPGCLSLGLRDGGKGVAQKEEEEEEWFVHGVGRMVSPGKAGWLRIV